MNIYLELTEAFNQSGRRAVICSGQAVVLHRLAVMSKDGDWILRESSNDLTHILSVLENYGAKYRFGAPLDLGWMQGGWSSHFEFIHDDIRVRTDFFTRPPRLSDEALALIWNREAWFDPPFTSARDLAQIKMTQREKDYPVIGELARIMPDVRDQLFFSRSAIDLIRLAQKYPDIVEDLAKHRPLLSKALVAKSVDDEESLRASLDEERRSMMKKDRDRLSAFEQAAKEWREKWPTLTSYH